MKLNLDSQTMEYLTAMGREAGLTVEFLAEVAVYNLIAVWMRDRNINIETGEKMDAVFDAGLVDG